MYKKSYPQLKTRKARKMELYTELPTLSTENKVFFQQKKVQNTNKCFVNNS